MMEEGGGCKGCQWGERGGNDGVMGGVRLEAHRSVSTRSLLSGSCGFLEKQKGAEMRLGWGRRGPFLLLLLPSVMDRQDRGTRGHAGLGRGVEGGGGAYLLANLKDRFLQRQTERRWRWGAALGGPGGAAPLPAMGVTHLHPPHPTQHPPKLPPSLPEGGGGGSEGAASTGRGRWGGGEGL